MTSDPTRGVVRRQSPSGLLALAAAVALLVSLALSWSAAPAQAAVAFPIVTPVAPSVQQSACAQGVASTPFYTLNGPVGVVYTVNGKPVTGTPVTGTVPAVPGSTVVVIASAAPGYLLSGNAVTSFVLTFGGPASCTTVPPPVVVVPVPVPAPAPPPGNLGIRKTGTVYAQPGDELVWNLVVSNTAGAVATGFTVTDALPAGLSFSGAQGADYVCNAVLQVITCTYNGSLAVGQTANLAVRALLDRSFIGVNVINTAGLDPNRQDTNAADNTSSAETDARVRPQPTPSPVSGGTTGGAAAPTPAPAVGALPFTGPHTVQFVQTGLAMLLLGWYFMTLGRRRPKHAR